MTKRHLTCGLILGTFLILSGGRVVPAPAPTPPRVSIVAVPLDARAPEKCLALVLDDSGDLRDAKSEVVDDNALGQMFQPAKGAQPVRYVKLTVADEEETSVAKLSKALTRLRSAIPKEGQVVIAVHLKNLKPKKP